MPSRRCLVSQKMRECGRAIEILRKCNPSVETLKMSNFIKPTHFEEIAEGLNDAANKEWKILLWRKFRHNNTVKATIAAEDFRRNK